MPSVRSGALRFRASSIEHPRPDPAKPAKEIEAASTVTACMNRRPLRRISLHDERHRDGVAHTPSPERAATSSATRPFTLSAPAPAIRALRTASISCSTHPTARAPSLIGGGSRPTATCARMVDRPSPVLRLTSGRRSTVELTPLMDIP